MFHGYVWDRLAFEFRDFVFDRKEPGDTGGGGTGEVRFEASGKDLPEMKPRRDWLGRAEPLGQHHGQSPAVEVVPSLT